MAAPPTSSSSEADDAAVVAVGGEGAPSPFVVVADVAAAVPDADVPLPDLLDNNEGQRNRHYSQNFDLLARAAAALAH